MRINHILFRSRGSRAFQLLPAILILVFAFVVPVVLLFVVSLWRFTPGGTFGPTALTLENYARNFTHPHYRLVIVRTLQQGFLTATACLILGYPFAYILARGSLKFRNQLLFFLFVPLFVSVVVRSFGWIVIMDHKGVINYVLTSIGLIEKPLRILDTMTAVIVGLLNVLLAFMVMPIYSVLVNIPRSYEEAARTMGAGPFITWLKVTLPLSLPGIVAGWTLVFSLSISSYVSPSVLGGAAYFVMSTVLYQQIRGVLNWPFAAAIGFLLLMIGLLSIYLPTWIVRRLTEFNGRGNTNG
jgi:putative spermidine/putrescine transport system permease protein